MKLTRWIGGKHKPTNGVGVYERDKGFALFIYSKWDGDQWMVGRLTPKQAERVRVPSGLQSLPWRGLAEKPQCRSGG